MWRVCQLKASFPLPISPHPSPFGLIILPCRKSLRRKILKIRLVQTIRKNSACFTRTQPYGATESPGRATRTQTGVLAPGDGFPHTGKPWKGERSFVPSALGLLGAGITGAYTPACGLGSLSGLGLAEQKIR